MLELLDAARVAHRDIERARDLLARAGSLRAAVDRRAAEIWSALVDDLAAGHLDPTGVDFTQRFGELAAIHTAQRGVGYVAATDQPNPVAVASARCTTAAWSTLLDVGREHAGPELRRRLVDADKAISKAARQLPAGADSDALPTAIASGNREIVAAWWDWQEARAARDKIGTALAELVTLGVVEPTEAEAAEIEARRQVELDRITGRVRYRLADDGLVRELGRQGLATDHTGAAIVVTGR